MNQLSYDAVMARKNEIMKKALGLDYDQFERTPIAFDYEAMMQKGGYSLEEVRKIQTATKVGFTPLVELKNINRLIRRISAPGKGARIFLKDEASNASGSFKARRASVSAYQAEKSGYQGMIAATSGNYGAAVASQAAQRGLKCIIMQEIFDSHFRGQPEIIEKARKCQAFGAEVVMLTVGPELFYCLLLSLERTGFFNASLYTPFGINGVETLGYEIIEQMHQIGEQDPDVIFVTHAGGGNLTGTARGARKAGALNTKIYGASVDLSGLHMASDGDFNKKSFTTGHTGFGVPFATWPDRTDVPRNAARPLRYMDRYCLVTQGEVFYTTELLAQLEGMERGPAGNTSLAAAIAVAREMDQDQTIVVQETEYTGAGKHPTAQLTFARENGVTVRRGDPKENAPGKEVVIPEHPEQLSVTDFPMEKLRRSYLKNIANRYADYTLTEEDYHYLSAEIRLSEQEIQQILAEITA